MIARELNEGVMTLRLDRPAKKNALTEAMYDDLSEGLNAAAADAAVRAVTIAAAGDDFCAGNDIADFARGLPRLQAAADIEDLPVFRFLKALTFFEKPLIAAVQARFPDFRFALTGRPDGYGDHVRFSWELGPEGGEGFVKGTDFAVLDGERLKAVSGFLDQVPAGA